MVIFNKLVLIWLIIVPLSLFGHSRGIHAAEERRASGDAVDGEDDANVEDVGRDGAVVSDKAGDDEEPEEDSMSLKPSPDADHFFFFTKPVGMGLDLPAGSDVQFLVGFTNKGKKDFLIETMDASFRYAMDFNFHLQNFSAIPYNRLVKPNQQTTLAYSFFISDAYSTRPYGLTVNLLYKDMAGNRYMNAVFNETVNIVEIDEGLDGETIFLYIFLAAIVAGLVFLAQHYLLSMNKKRSTPKAKVEVGTINSNDVDYDWLPKQTLLSLNKSSRNQKYSAAVRKVKKATGNADDK